MKKIILLVLVSLYLFGCSPFRANNSGFKGLNFDPDDPNAPIPPGAPVCTSEYRIKAIYGDDNRSDWFEIAGAPRDYWAAATVALMPAAALANRGSYYQVVGPTYGEAQNLCQGVRFAEQPQAAFCSGFLVGEDLVVTAGHCLQTQADCEATRFVFNFSKRFSNQTQYNIDKDDVYSCSQLVARSMSGTDYAVVRLDRAVIGRTPLNIRRQGQLQAGEELVLIGHPSGIPSKIAAGGTVLSVGKTIVAGVDAFAGNSGSVVVNAATGFAEGILVAGEPDFEAQGSCQVEYRCGTSRCSGEVITPIGDLLKHIPERDFIPPDVTCP